MRFVDFEEHLITKVTMLGGRVERVADINTISRDVPKRAPAAHVQLPVLKGPEYVFDKVGQSGDTLQNTGIEQVFPIAVWLRMDEDHLEEYDDFVEHFFQTTQNVEIGPPNESLWLRIPMVRPITLGRQHALIQFNVQTIDLKIARCR